MRVYVIAAYPTVRAGLAALVRERDGWTVAGESAPGVAPRLAAGGATDGSGAAAMEVDVVLADLDGVSESGQVDDWLARLNPRGGVVTLTSAETTPPRRRDGRDGVRLIGELALAAGERGVAFGALLRDATPDEIVAAINAVAGGLITLDRRLATDLLAAPERLSAETADEALIGEDELTPRELEVLQLMAQGLPNKLIANRLHISEHTAKFHVSAILMKLGAASRTEAVTRAARRGLLIL